MLGAAVATANTAESKSIKLFYFLILKIHI